MKVLLVSGSGSGVGTSAIVLGLLSALRGQGLRVQPFYVGIGIKHCELYEVASDRRCVILDPQILSKQYCLRSLAARQQDTDIAIVEGGSGGLLDDEQGGAAVIAKWIGAPVVLIVDGRHSSGISCAATVKGFSEFDPELSIAAAVLNRMSGKSQIEGMKKGLGSTAHQITLLGGIPDQMLSGFQGRRYSDLLYKGDKSAIQCMVDSFQELVQTYVEMDAVLSVANKFQCSLGKLSTSPSNTHVKIAVARDEAFDTSIEDNLMLMRLNGAQLVSFSAIRDVQLPVGVQGLYLSANMLVQYSQSLAANRQLQSSIKAFADAGGIIYAEGGALQYLCRQLEPQCDMPCRMVGVLPFRARLCDPQTEQSAKGSVQQQCTIVEERVLGTFQNQSTDPNKSFDTCFQVSTKDSDGNSSTVPEGYCVGNNVLGTQILINFMSNPDFATSFVQACQAVDLGQIQQHILNAQQAYEQELQQWEQQCQQQLSQKLFPTNSVPNLAEPRWQSMQYNNVLDSGLFSNAMQPNLSNQSLQSSNPGSLNGALSNLSRLDVRLRTRSNDYPQPQVTCRKSDVQNNTPQGLTRNKSLSDLKRALTPVIRESQLYRASHFQADLIISLSPGATQTIVALGLTQRLAGVTQDCELPDFLSEEVKLVAWNKNSQRNSHKLQDMDHNNLSSQQDSQYQVDIGLIENMWPGTVIVDSKYADVLNSLFRMTRTVKVQLDVRTFSDLLESIVQLGEVLDVPDGAKYLVESLQSRVRRVSRKVLGSKRLPRVILIQGVNPYKVGSYLVDELIHYAGGVNAWMQTGLEEKDATWEHILNCDPEVLVLASKKGLQDAVQLAGSPGWWNIQAVKRGKVYLCDYQMFEEGGPGLIRGVETLAGILHPEIMNDDKFFSPELVMKMSLKDGQRCRHRMIPNFFKRLSEQI